MSKAQHTPTPWYVDDSHGYAITIIAPWSDKVTKENFSTYADYRGSIIASLKWNSGVPTHETAIANAELIVKAVNCHDELLAALEEINNLKSISGLPEHLHALITAMKIVSTEAINKAKQS